MNKTAESSTATLAAGCFWGVEQRFRQLGGVYDVRVGYIGGHTQRPTYRQVCGGDTGHAEAVEICFDPTRVSFDQLLDVFFQLHDPTTLNRQGPDVGSQYRSAIFFHNAEQQKIATSEITKLNASGRWKNPIVTEVTAVSEFFAAEEYHQRYFEKNPGSGCMI